MDDALSSTSLSPTSSEASRDSRVDQDRLIFDHRALAGQIARRYSPGNDVDEDLLSVATIALVAAARRFDPSHGTPFHAYAAPSISGEIKRFLRDQTWAAHVPRRVKELSLEIEAVQRDAQQRLGRSLSVTELADRVRVDVEEIMEGLNATASRRSGSLSSFERAAESHNWDRVTTRLSIDLALDLLSESERATMVLRYGEDLTQTEIGERLGFSQPHVHRLISRSLDKLRGQFDPAALRFGLSNQ